MLASKKEEEISSLVDKSIADDYSKTAVNIRSESGLIMKLIMEMDKKTKLTNFIASVDFFNESAKTVDVSQLSSDVVSDLLYKYKEYVIKLLKDKQQEKISPKSRVSDTTKATIKKISLKDFSKIKTTAQGLFQDLRTMNVITVYSSKKIEVARTTIELDADIVTIIGLEIQQYTNVTKTLLTHLHIYNTYLANHLFALKIKKFFLNIKSTVNIVRLISVPVWVIPNLLSTVSTLPSFSILTDDPNIMFVLGLELFNVIGVPALLLKFIPRIIGYIIRHTILSRSL
jgi:hypothetical protein